MPRPKPIQEHVDEHPDIPVVNTQELAATLKSNHSAMSVLDVRTDKECEGGHVIGSRHVCSERILDAESGPALVKEILATYAAAGTQTVVVHCMYSQCRGPTIANILASAAKSEGRDISIALLEGGFHKFLNDVHTENAMQPESINDVPGLVGGVKPHKWRRTAKHGLVEADAYDAIDQLTPQGGSMDAAKMVLKSYQGEMSLEGLTKLCQSVNPGQAVPAMELEQLFTQLASRSSSQVVDWQEFVDLVYSGPTAGISA